MSAQIPPNAPSKSNSTQQEDTDLDPKLTRVVQEEETCLGRIIDHSKEQRTAAAQKKQVDYDTQLLDLRDEIAAARTEDVPPLLEQMERLQGIAARQRQLTTGYIDPNSPYFGRMVLCEDGRNREVLIGRSTYLNSKAGVRIVDWRDAPVSRLYYRYNEGDDYEETFGEREVEGEVVVRRSLTIVEGRLRRVVTPESTYLRPQNGQWRSAGGTVKLQGGQGSAPRPGQARGGKLGIGAEADMGEDKHLREITALIDPRQFELITKPDSGLVVIQGGAGSGKTTIGLHRLAYLAYQDRRRFRPDRMLVVVFNDALARYISQVLPALGVNGVGVQTYQGWAARLRQHLAPRLPKKYSDQTPPAATKLKKHPALLDAIAALVEELEEEAEQRIRTAARGTESEEAAVAAWRATRKRPLSHRAHGLRRWVERNSSRLPVGLRHGLERESSRLLRKSENLVHSWADLLTDRGRLQRCLAQRPHQPISERELKRALDWCSQRTAQILHQLEQDEERRDTIKANPNRDRDDEPQEPREERVTLDQEDDTLMLLLWQRLRGAVWRPGSKEALVYEHILVDEAQDLSPLEMGVVMGCVSRAQSITLAGDVAQRLHMDNGFSGWEDTLSELGLSHVQIEPLRLSYRSTAEIVEFSRGVLGPLADEHAPKATRNGAPVELFRFADAGEAVGFLADALRELLLAEPSSSVAVVARHPEQADLFHLGLKKAETPKLRRVADQDFLFKPGIDVTDIRQVKGLEFDYVVLVEVSEATYPLDDEARHLLHIGATRAAHQLWVLTSGAPSGLLPQQLRDRSY